MAGAAGVIITEAGVAIAVGVKVAADPSVCLEDRVNRLAGCVSAGFSVLVVGMVAALVAFRVVAVCFASSAVWDCDASA